MKRRRSHPTRLVDQSPEGNSGQIAALIHSAREAPDEDTSPVKWRIRNTLRQRVEWRRRALRVALVGALVFLTGGVVGAVVQPILASRAHSKGQPAVETRMPAAHGTHKRSRPQPPHPEGEAVASQESAAPPALMPPTQVAETVSVAADATHTPISPPSRTAAPNKAPAAHQRPAMRPIALQDLHASASFEPPAPSPSAPAQVSVVPPAEQILLASALRRLRTAHDPESALAALDDYAARFPGGVLVPEAARLRTEALLLLGRKSAALDELDKPSPDATPISEERRVLRGELRASAGRWRAALEDFDSVVRGRPSDEAGAETTADARSRERLERALWGRASARSHLGDDAGARADVRECLRRFPHGRFAVEAARLLGEQP